MTLLQQMARAQTMHREKMRSEAQCSLKMALREFVPAQPVIIFGSLVKPGSFSEASDVDLALWSEPPGLTIYQLSSILAERLGRRVDIVLLPECRFHERVLREGESWMPQA
jgi:predicted nucleotidyltransferase